MIQQKALRAAALYVGRIMSAEVNRRELAAALLAALQVEAAQKPVAAGHRVFREVAASLYAWDLAFEGIEPVLDTLQQTAKVNSVYLVALMHHERRPLTDHYFPHNPRKTYFPEDSRTYWRPHAASYQASRIKPLATEREEFRKTDWVAELASAARRRGMKTGAEISHTLLDMERARGEFRDVVQRDIWGNRLGQLVCYNHPDARAYVTALFHDLAANYDLDYVQTCMLPFAQARLPVFAGLGGERHQANTLEFGFWGSLPEDLREALHATTLGGCFCEHCAAAAKEMGLDPGAMRRALLPVANAFDHPSLEEAHGGRLRRASNSSAMLVLLEHPEILDLVRFRCATMARVYREIHDTMARARPKIDFRENAHLRNMPEFAGLSYAQLKPALGSIRSSDYSEQSGRTERMDDKRRFLLALRAAVGEDAYMLSAIGVRPQATPELIRKGVQISAECGADGITLGHYDGAPLRNLEAVGQGLAEAGVHVL
jgi:hypothetical protein